MSGHSKWSQIKRKKGKTDQERGKLFSKLIKEITVAARSGADPDTNPRLRTVMQIAKAANMPADNVERAVKKGTGELPGVVYEEVVYEGYGPGGVAILVQCLTENRNRTAGDIRHIFTKYNGNMGGSGTVAWKFENRGVITVGRGAIEEETLLTVALDAGALDVDSGDPEFYEIVTPMAALETVRKTLADHGIPVSHAELTKIPQNAMKLDSAEAERVLRLMDALEDHEDAQKVWSDLDIPEDVLQKM